jgi:hypothetical protein
LLGYNILIVLIFLARLIKIIQKGNTAGCEYKLLFMGHTERQLGLSKVVNEQNNTKIIQKGDAAGPSAIKPNGIFFTK